MDINKLYLLQTSIKKKEFTLVMVFRLLFMFHYSLLEIRIMNNGIPIDNSKEVYRGLR